MDSLSFASSIVLGFFTLIGVIWTHRGVRRVRQENTSQHAAAEVARQHTLQALQDAHNSIAGKVESAHGDVVTLTVARVDQKLADHMSAPHMT